MARLGERLFLFLVAVVVLCWGGYHFYRYYNDPLQFETVFEYTVPRALTSTGIAIREELLIEAAHAGIESFLFDDATRVATGETVAEYYQDRAGDSNVKRLREIEREMRMLEEAQNKNVNNLSNADAINREIRDKIGVMTSIAATGRCSPLSEARTSLVTLVNRRQIAVGRAENYEERIAGLQEEHAKLSASTGGESAVQTVKAPVTGFFARKYDGYESLVSLQSLQTLDIAGFTRLIERDPPIASGDQVGRIVTNQVWYFAVPLPLYESEWLRKDAAVDLQLDQVAGRIPATVYDLRFENNSETVLAVFRSNYMSGEIINLRVSGVTVYSAQYTGLRIPTSALYFRENPLGKTERGVYVLDGNTVRFKLVYPVYEDQSFLLSALDPVSPVAPSDEEALTPSGEEYKTPPAVKQYDLVITKGIDLYDGKPVQ